MNIPCLVDKCIQKSCSSGATDRICATIFLFCAKGQNPYSSLKFGKTSGETLIAFKNSESDHWYNHALFFPVVEIYYRLPDLVEPVGKAFLLQLQVSLS